MPLGSLTEKELRSVLRASVGPNGRVVFTKHARERMKERNISDQDVQRVLKRGVPDPGCSEHYERGCWRYRRRSGETVVVVVVHPPDKVVLITVIA